MKKIILVVSIFIVNNFIAQIFVPGGIVQDSNNENVGIGTNTPTALIETKKVNIDSKNTFSAFFNMTGATGGSNMIGLGYHNKAIIELNAGYTGDGWRYGTYFDFNLENSSPYLGYGNINLITQNEIRMRISHNGNIGINTLNPDEKLTVNGKIHASEVKVDYQVPADYVFEEFYNGKSTLKPEYRLLTLSEVEKFTRENNHLPNIPSAKEIKENGMELGEMTNLLLQKVEELTLYIIKQEKEINDLKAQLIKK